MPAATSREDPVFSRIRATAARGALSHALLFTGPGDRLAAARFAAAAHQYVVSMAVADWFTITHKTDAPEYSSLAEVSLQIISEAVNKRSRPKRTVSTAGQ